MNVSVKYLVLTLLLLVGSGIRAQNDFNPTNPPEPNTLYKVTVKATPGDKANASGTGRYKKGDRIRVNASASDSDYEFKYWKKDGERTTYGNSFYYTVEEKDVVFEAVYALKNFDPTNPADPNMSYKFRVYLNVEPQEACSFNLNNGARYLPGNWVDVRAYASQGFVFQGWYDADDGYAKLSDASSFNYEMPERDAHLVARFKFNPTSPDDPFQNPDKPQTDVDYKKSEDINGDGVIDVTDAAIVVNQFLSSSEFEPHHDMNNDGVVDVTDAAIIVNVYLEN